jgi:MscS family membrane protein
LAVIGSNPAPALAEPAQAGRTQPTVKELVEKTTKAEPEQPADHATGEVPDEIGRGTPRSTMEGFLAATRARDFDRAAQYLDLRNLPPEVNPQQGPRLARQLKIVLDRALWIDLDLLSADPGGDTRDNLPDDRNRLGQIALPGKPVDLFLQRVTRGDGGRIWNLAATSVAEIPELYRTFGYGGLEDIFPAWFFDYQVLGIEVWRWAATILVAVAAIPLAMLATASLIALLRRLRPELAAEADRFLVGPLRLLAWAILGRAVLDYIGHSFVTQAVAHGATAVVIALAWLLLRLLDLAAARMTGRLESKGLAGSAVLLRPATRLLKLVVLVGAVLLWLDNLGYRITTLLAGLSISGVAVALAAQKSLENVFGAVTLYTSQPVRVGDLCRFGNQVGTVEEIGLRSTRVRTLNRSLVSVASGEFAAMHLENLSARDRFWYHPNLRLRYETAPTRSAIFRWRSGRCCTPIRKC